MRNRYEEALGVAALEWKHGEPSSEEYMGPYLVEVWRPSLNLSGPVPVVSLHAQIEVRVLEGGTWKYIRWNGVLVDCPAGKIRRHAALPYRWAHVNVLLDKWSALR